MKDRFKEISRAEALAKVAELKKEYLDFRFQMVLGHVENPLHKRTLRRQISRLNTIVSEFDRGVRKA
ncbi:MAG: 50S ribosomal protein L29 [Spirochaetales bacterium]|nr:50S ribosomal protein L29 [Spirochaetales bacterium]